MSNPLKWQDAMPVLLSDYKPCETFTESTHQYTSNELKQKLEDFCGVEVDLKEMVDILNAWGFKYARTGDLELEWLLRMDE